MTWQLSSPDTTLTIQVSLDDDGSLTYRVQHTANDITSDIVHSSRMGFLHDSQDFSQLRFDSASDIRVIDEAYEMLTGKARQLRNHAHEQTLTFRNEHDVKFQVILRAYDDGVAFRYALPEKDETVQIISKELTTFAMPKDGKMWAQPYDYASVASPAYERFYSAGIPVDTRAHVVHGVGWAFPVLISANGYWTMLTEADLDGHYVASHLGNWARDGVFEIDMPLANEALSTGRADASIQTPWVSPWRVIMVGQSIATILESNLVFHLSPPTTISDTSWIMPGRSSWSWWSDEDSSRNFEALRNFVDLAVAMKWEYSLVDANWNVMQGGTLEELVAYADSQGVGLFVWYNSAGTHNEVPEQPRNKMSEREIRRQEFAWLNALGIRGVKIDFFQSDKQHVIKQYVDILEDAADFQIMVNFHGSTLPRGWQRTYPHLMTMESVPGAEQYKFDRLFPQLAASQSTILPFTRNVVGSMDYTPVTFTNVLHPHQTTSAHELALSVVFESGIVHFADSAESFLGLPDDVRRFLSDVPAVWDETRYIDGMPNDFVVIARRHRTDWYIAGLNGRDESHSITVDVQHVIGDGDYQMLMITDDSHGDFAIQDGSNSRQVIALDMQAKGGFVIQYLSTNSE